MDASTARTLAPRSRIVLERAEGHSIMEASPQPKSAPDTVRTWRRRFLLDRGPDDLSDGPRPGVPRKATDADAERVIVKTLEEEPPNATRRSARSMALGEAAMPPDVVVTRPT
ncbi:helix-turn-helix domain-containing protein [Streptomyces populi]|uniref:helix-turn-helix domain-containing protein n=1 Tax=Streptomyces populi TaxID=2058924 RepID=UPI001F0BAD9D|nr:helix-turn-helix domain-containing protein [Streptomyces populi]